MIAVTLRGYGRYLRSLPGFFADPLTVAQARAQIQENVATRADRFLRLLRERVYTPGSPYRMLLDATGIGPEAVEQIARTAGLEAALGYLRDSGVYLTFQEFKEGRGAWRGDRVYRFQPEQFDNPHPVVGIPTRSGATRSRGTWSSLTLEHLAAGEVAHLGLVLDAFVGEEAPVLTWQLGFPSGAGIASWFALGRLRRSHARWFSLTPIDRRPWQRHMLLFRAARRAARRAGLERPAPEYMPVQHTGQVLDIILGVRRQVGPLAVMTTPSCAVRLCAAARGRGASLEDVMFLAGAEPLTPGKAAEITRAGARVASYYAMAEVEGYVGVPCANPSRPDEMHFLSDHLAFIRNPRVHGDVSLDALMVTTLHASAPKLLLNVEIDDFALIDERRCGCLWDQLGCQWHLSGVRSFTKLTGEGTTVLGTNCVQIIEEVLPQTFGGSSVDYQLLEAEDEHNLTRLFLLMSPRLGPVDERRVTTRFLEALEATRDRPLGGTRSIWSQAESIRVLRQDPIPTGSGKLFPFHTLAGPPAQAGVVPS